MPKNQLFSPLEIKSINFKNRIWMSPMCQYSSHEGHPSDWHLVHLGSRAVGGVGMVMVEATAVTPEGRISAHDNGIWSDDHIPGFKRLSDFIKGQGAVSGIQIAHAGRKASTPSPWPIDNDTNKTNSSWETIAPSPIPFKQGMSSPREMSLLDINNTVMDFQSAAIRCLESGFQVLELHMAHGYLMHQFLSPISNQRDDDYGGCYDNRVRFPLAVARAVRNVWPDNLPLFVRISATDWADGRQELMTLSEKSPPRSNAWNLLESIAFSRQLKDLGMDLIDCSSGGTLASADIPIEPGYQVPFSEMIKKECGIMTAAVGLITDPQQAESILQKQQADAVFLGRELLRNPYWVIDSSSYFGIPMPPPNQYKRAYE